MSRQPKKESEAKIIERISRRAIGKQRPESGPVLVTAAVSAALKSGVVAETMLTIGELAYKKRIKFAENEEYKNLRKTIGTVQKRLEVRQGIIVIPVNIRMFVPYIYQGQDYEAGIDSLPIGPERAYHFFPQRTHLKTQGIYFPQGSSDVMHNAYRLARCVLPEGAVNQNFRRLKIDVLSGRIEIGEGWREFNRIFGALLPKEDLLCLLDAFENAVDNGILTNFRNFIDVY